MTNHMRLFAWPVAVACFALLPVRAGAQDPSGAAAAIPALQSTPSPLSSGWSEPASTAGQEPNFVDVGGRGTNFSDNSDPARFQRYRDVSKGPVLDLLRYRSDNDTRRFRVEVDHAGYRDQRYFAAYNGFGKLKASFEWNQFPLFISQDTATAFTSAAPGVLLLPDPVQSAVQGGTANLSAFAAIASPFDLRLKRGVADARVTYRATRNLDLNFVFRNTAKSGEQPWSGTFGFNNAVMLPVPVDTHTSEIDGSAEWTHHYGVVRVGYEGSFFRNNVSAITWDNPLRLTDSPTLGPAQGRMTLWPDSNINSGNVSGIVKLPKRSQATAYVSMGRWSTNNPLIPFTINSALVSPALDRPTADTKANVTSTAFTFNTRPTDMLWLNARFRTYDFDNRTPVFNVPTTVSYDTSVVPFAEGGTSPYGFTRKTFDAEASLTPITYAAFRAGYTREAIKQTFRVFDKTTEDIVRLSADATGVSWLTVRGVYEHGHRVGSGLDEQTLDDIGEQVSLRQFDISNRDSDRFSAIVMVTPVSRLSFNGTAAVGREDRPQTVFGLRSNDNHSFSVGMDYVPGNTVSMGWSYEHEKFKTLQNSRQANPGAQFDDPTRDWTTNGDDLADTISASVDLLKLVKKTDIRAAYDYSRAKSTYIYGVAPNSTLATPVQLPPVTNTFHRGTLDARYYLTTHVAAGLVYWYDRYRVNDFAFSPQTINTVALPSFLYLGYLYRPYTANTLTVRLTYLW